MEAKMLKLSTSDSWWLRENSSRNISPIDHLYNRLDGMYPNKFRANFASESALQNWREAWAEAFDEERITGQDVANGLVACRKNYDWPPSLTEFLKACRPPINPDTAYYEAVEGLTARRKGDMGVWTHPAIFFASTPLAYDLLNSSYSQMKERWRDSLAKEIAKGAWGEIPRPHLALQAPGKNFASKEEAKQRISEIKADDIFKPMAKAQRDPKAWAKKILRETETKERIYPDISIQFAKEALKNA
jgi:hypothetical protein